MPLGNISSASFDDSHPPTDEELRRLTFFPEMSTIALKDCRIADSSLRWVAQLPHLQYVVISDASITDAGLEHLRDLTELRQVDLSGNVGITGIGFRDWKCTDTLIELVLTSTGMTLEGLQELRRFKKLRWLQLDYSAAPLDDEKDEETEAWEVLLELPELETVSGLPNGALEVWSRHPNFPAFMAKHSGEPQP